MNDMWYVEIQPIDHDDYPVNSPERIGPFESEKAAEDWLSEKGIRKNQWKYYNTLHRGGWRETIAIRNLKDLRMHLPDTYKGFDYVK